MKSNLKPNLAEDNHNKAQSSLRDAEIGSNSHNHKSNRRKGIHIPLFFSAITVLYALSSIHWETVSHVYYCVMEDT